MSKVFNENYKTIPQLLVNELWKSRNEIDIQYCLELCDRLKNNEINFMHNGMCLLEMAINKCRTKLIIALLNKKNINVNMNYKNVGNNPLSYAANIGNIEIAELAISLGINVNINPNYPPLMAAIRHGHNKIVLLLLEQPNIDVNLGKDKNALHIAAENGKLEIIKILLDKPSVDINCIKNYNSALILAAKNGMHNTVELLLEYEGINVNIKDYDWTALMYAAKKGYSSIVRLLLKRDDIDINLENDDNESALTLACKKGRYRCAELLINDSRLDWGSEGNYEAEYRASDNKFHDIVDLFYEDDEDDKYKN